MNVLALCAGIGGLELGLHLAEPRANPVVFVEQNEFCRSVLAARWPGVPIWDDVTTFDGRPWAGEASITGCYHDDRRIRRISQTHRIRGRPSNPRMQGMRRSAACGKPQGSSLLLRHL